MKRTKISMVLAIALLLISGINSCETGELDLLNDPSNVTPEVADADLLLNSVQINFAKFLEQMNDRSMEFIRMKQLFGSYTGPFAMTPASLNNDWAFAYSSMLQDNETLLQVAQERELSFYLGISKLLKAYMFVVLVDTFGEVPFSEALQGAGNANPNVDSGDFVCAEIFALIDEALSDLSQTSLGTPSNDLFYGGNRNNWIKLANTLKLKMYNQTRLVDASASIAGITAIVNEGNFINEKSEDFQYSYSATVSPADSRHFQYINNYASAGAVDYMSNYYMFLLKDEKSLVDPRLRYYIYRQTNTDPEGDFLPCDGDANIDFCYVGDFYWGRDHADDEGVPGDNLLRATWGLYPTGGTFDADQFQNVSVNPGAGGAGILPIFLSCYVDFILAETALTLGTPGNPRNLLESAIRKSMDKVLNFIPSGVDASFAATQSDVDNYLVEVLALYDAASQDEQLNINIKEYYLALFGNGFEAYNNYRKTGYPSDMQSPVIQAGAFPRTFFYPSNLVNLNSSVTQKNVSEQVFWDTNPSGFID